MLCPDIYAPLAGCQPARWPALAYNDKCHCLAAGENASGPRTPMAQPPGPSSWPPRTAERFDVSQPPKLPQKDLDFVQPEGYNIAPIWVATDAARSVPGRRIEIVGLLTMWNGSSYIARAGEPVVISVAGLTENPQSTEVVATTTDGGLFRAAIVPARGAASYGDDLFHGDIRIDARIKVMGQNIAEYGSDQSGSSWPTPG
jgi:hypothetical protein